MIVINGVGLFETMLGSSIRVFVFKTERLDTSLVDESMRLSWARFEDEVSQLYRDLGADVKQNVNLAGFQIDVYVEEETPSKQKIRSAIECKFYKDKIGNRIVNDFVREIETLKQRKLVDKGVIVSYAGFSAQAHEVAKNTGVELRHIKDIKTITKRRKEASCLPLL